MASLSSRIANGFNVSWMLLVLVFMFVFVLLGEILEEFCEHIRNILFVVFVVADFVLHVCRMDVVASGFDGGRVS